MTSSNTTETSLNLAAGPPDSLGRQTAGGLVWMTSQTILTKLLVVVSQIILAWKLQGRDFYLVALAYAAAAFPSLIQQIGLREVLIQRHLEFSALASSATWLSLFVGIVTGLGIAIAAPIAARIYHEPALTGLILVLAATAPFTSLMQIPLAALQIEMRHRTVALSGLITATLNPLLSIGFAVRGFGAYSFLLPILLTTILRLILLWFPARIPFNMRLGLALWPQMIRSGILLFVTWVFFTVISQGDYLILGWFDKSALAFYYFAFNLSVQTVALLGPNLDSVLLPALSRLQAQPARQREAFLLVSGAIAFFAFPLCFLQAALAGPITRIFFGFKWAPAIPVFAILSIGMAFRTCGWVTHNLFLAQGRYKVFALFHAAASFVFVALVFSAVVAGGSWGGRAKAVAIVVSAYFAAESLVKMFLAMRPMNGSLSDVSRTLLLPMVLSGMAVLASSGIARLVPAVQFRDWLQLGLVPIIAGGLFLLAAWRFMPQMLQGIWDRAAALLLRRTT